MRQTSIDFYTSDHLSLIGLVTAPNHQKTQSPVLVAANSHPMFGGNMNDPLITKLCNAAVTHGIASLRFDFRGVGKSQGEFTNGSKEQIDLKAAIDILDILPDIDSKRLILVGHSFGAAMILKILKQFKKPCSLILIAPPISSVMKSKIIFDNRPKLFMVGQNDHVVSSIQLKRILDGAKNPVPFVEIQNSNHLLHGQEKVVAERVIPFINENLSQQYA